MFSPFEYRSYVRESFEQSIVSGDSPLVAALSESLSQCDIRGEISGEIPISLIGEYPEQILWRLYSMKNIYENKGWRVRFVSSNYEPDNPSFYSHCIDVTDDDVLSSTLDIYFSISHNISE